MIVRPAPRRGQFEDEFWAWVQQQDLRLQSCTDCGRFRYPPGPTCPRCLSERASWKSLSGMGRLLSWAVFRRSYFDSMPLPYVVAAIETAEGPIMVGNLMEPTESLRVDAPMQVYYELSRTTSGDDLTICQWKLSEDVG
jgi:uncharacterized OB-fold protein